jgi:hypothetical protein
MVKIQPQLADLKFSSITYPTLRGSISCHYQRLSGRFRKYSIELPANMVGELMLDNVGDAEVRVNGRRQITQFGSIRLDPGPNTVEIRIHSF